MKKRKALKILGIIVAVIVLFVCFNLVTNIFTNKNSLKFVKSFEKVQIENQLVPEKDENGNWTFTTDRELKVMHLTDIHIGGGWFCAKLDKMALNAVAQSSLSAQLLTKKSLTLLLLQVILPTLLFMSHSQ